MRCGANWESIEVNVRARPALFVLIALTSAVTSDVIAQDDGREQLLHYSLQVDVDEEARTQLAASQAELARGDLLTAVSRWRALLDSSKPGSLVPFRGAFASIPTAIRASVQSLPDAVRDEYLRMTEPIAARALIDALAMDDPDRLWSVVDRFPGTVAATEACVQLAERCFDAGRFAECRLAVDRWLDSVDHPQAASAAEPRMAVWRLLSLRALGEAAADTRWSESLPPDLRQIVDGIETTQLIPVRRSDEIAPPSTDDVAELLPSEQIVWSIPLSSEGRGTWTSLQEDFERLAQPLLMVGRPAVTPQGVVVSGTGHRLIDPADGTVKWSVSETAAPAGTRRDLLAGLRRALGESVAGRSTIDNQRLFSIGSTGNASPQSPFANQIDAHALVDGFRLNSIRRAMALGPPVAGHGQLYAVIQSGEQLSLAAFNLQSFELQWQTRLGDAGLSLMTDLRRQWMPAVVDASGNSVLCATGNGAVAAVDPRSGRIRWIHRSEREDWRNAGPPQATAVASSPRFRTWTGWREPVLKRIGETVLWAGPEADSLTALDPRTGERRWSHPRGDGLAVVASGETLLVLADQEVRRINAVDGATLWSAPIAQPSGIGFVGGAWYVQPLRSGGCVAIRLVDGSTTRGVAWATEVLKKPRQALDEFQSLTWSPDGLLVQTPTSVLLHRTVAALRKQTPGTPATAQWLAAAGRLGDAANALTSAGEVAALHRRRLQLIERETTHNQFHPVARPFERLPELSVDQAVDQQVEAFLLDRRPETAGELLARSPLEQLAAVWVESNRKPRLRMRADVLAARTILERSPENMTSTVSPAGRARLDDLLKRVATARPDDVTGILNLLSSSDWGASKILERSPSPTIRTDSRELARLRLTLLALESRADDSSARAAQVGESLQPAIADLTDWPGGEPVVSERKWKSLIGQWPAQFTPLDDSELKGLSIDVLLTGFNRRVQGVGVHFAGCGQNRPWEINLSRSDRSLSQASEHRQGFGIGPLVVMQTATGLHGLLPFNADGERQASRLWDVPWIDMWGKVATHSVSYLPRLSDVAPGRHPLDADEFGRPLTQVGPVTASYFCYREFDRLVCCDSATGRRRWDRAAFEPDHVAVGDEHAVVVVSPASRRAEILDPLNGELLSSRASDLSASHWRTAIDTTVLLRTGARQDTVVPDAKPREASELLAVDLKTGQPKWKQALDPGAIEFVVGRRLAGAVDPQGIRFIDLATGEEQKQVAIQTPAGMADVVAVDDPFAVMICVFRQPAVEQLRPPLQLLGSRRKPYANGMVYGFDPATLALKWSIPLERSIFPLDQPRDIPLLVVSDALIAASGGIEIRQDRIRCFDKRTGRQVGRDLTGELVGSTGIVIERSQEAGWVDVRTSKGVFRFQFAAGP